MSDKKTVLPMRSKTYALLFGLAFTFAAAALVLPAYSAAMNVDVYTIPGVDPHTIPGVDPHTIPGIDPHTIPGVDPHTIPGVDPH